MRLTTLNEHLELLKKLEKSEETLSSLWTAAVPGAQVITGMPHATGVSDKVGRFAIEIADMEQEVESLKKRIEESEKCISEWIRTIDDGTTRVIFRLRYIQGMQWKEISGIVGKYVSEDSIKHVAYRYLNDEQETPPDTPHPESEHAVT